MLKSRIYITVCTIVLFLVSMFNILGTIPESYMNQDLISEQLIVGRLIRDEVQGIGSDSFLLCYASLDDQLLSTDNISDLSEESYANCEFQTYEHQMGVQGAIYSFFNLLLPFSIPVNLFIFRLLTTFFSALMIVIFINYVSKGIESKYGLIVTALLACFFFIYYMALSRNLYWCVWSFYLPFIAAKKVVDGNYKTKWFILFFLAVLFRCSCGFEYISAILVMASIPLFIDFFQKSNLLKLFAKRLTLLFVVSICSFISALFLSVLQLGVKYQSFKYGLNEYILNISRRTFGLGDMSIQTAAIKESLNASVITVLTKYLFSPVCLVISLLIVVSIMYYFHFERRGNSIKNIRMGICLSVVGLLGPLSWFILAKGHSYIHTHLNYILWDIPFSVIALVTILRYVEERLLLKKKSINIFLFLMIAISIIGSYGIQTLKVASYNNPLREIIFSEYYEYKIGKSNIFFRTEVNIEKIEDNMLFVKGATSTWALLKLDDSIVMINGKQYEYSVDDSDSALLCIIIDGEIDYKDIDIKTISIERK